MHEGFTDLNPEVKPVGPSLLRQAINLSKAIPAMINDGFRSVPDLVYNDRMRLCNSCEHWDEEGNLGLGKCNHPKCGCTRGKMKQASSECPMGNWGSYA